MTQSMTGYGRGEQTGAGKRFSVEIKSVNHRYGEVVIRQPRQLAPLEDGARKLLLERVSRGRLDVFVSLEEDGEASKVVKVDKGLALAYYNALKELEELVGSGVTMDYRSIPKFPEVVRVEVAEDDLDQLWAVYKSALEQAIGQLITMRGVEGAKLREDLLGRAAQIEAWAGEIAERAPLVVDAYREKLLQRIHNQLPDITIDETRLATEVAMFADRCSITEELVRLNSHLDQLRKSLALTEPVGRKLDFLVQEMNREVNTIGSKANDLAITNIVVNLKSEIEKIREQIQNIE
ncbi:MAG TPA: YicC/YloC family endoribonuclease [Bacillota bacterium]|nr:YicC/YloC family endoribonuclease [Bacillota bacterium]